MAQWPPLPMKGAGKGHERSLSPRPSPPEGVGSVVSRCRDFRDKVPDAYNGLALGYGPVYFTVYFTS